MAVLVSASLLGACGGSDGAGPVSAGANLPDTGEPPPDPGGAPTISGNPQTMVMQATQYGFAPSAQDPDNDPLSFFVTGLPDWATFDPATGSISGLPGAGDVGAYPGITVGVTAGGENAFLPAFEIDVVATALGSAALSWVPPTMRTDGSPLLDLDKYRIYWGMSAGSYPNSVTLENEGLAAYVIDQLVPATWYFAIAVIDSQGVESSLSNPVTKLVM